MPLAVPLLGAKPRTDSGGLATLAAAATISDGTGIVVGGGKPQDDKGAAVVTDRAGVAMVGSLEGVRGDPNEGWGSPRRRAFGGGGGVTQGVISPSRGSNGGPVLRAGGDAGESCPRSRSTMMAMVQVPEEVTRQEVRDMFEGGGSSAMVVRGSPVGRFGEVAAGDGGSTRDAKRMRVV